MRTFPQCEEIRDLCRPNLCRWRERIGHSGSNRKPVASRCGGGSTGICGEAQHNAERGIGTGDGRRIDADYSLCARRGPRRLWTQRLWTRRLRTRTLPPGATGRGPGHPAPLNPAPLDPMPPDAVPLEADPTHSTHSDADPSHPAYPADPDADRAPPDLVHPDMDTPGAFGSSASGRGLGARRLQIWRLIIVK